MVRLSPMHGQLDGETGPEAHPRKGIQPYPGGSPRPDPPLRACSSLVS